MYTYYFLLLCIYLLYVGEAGGEELRKHVCLIALDLTSYTVALDFARNIHHYNSSNSDTNKKSVSISIYAAMSDTPHNVPSLAGTLKYRTGVIKAKPLLDTRISRTNKIQEKVTAILEVLELESKYITRTGSEDDTGAKVGGDVLVGLAFRTGATLHATSAFHHIFDRFEKSSGARNENEDKNRVDELDVLLLEKTRGFRSMSTWHDLQVVALKLAPISTLKGQTQPPAVRWLQTLQEVYKRHSQGPVYETLEPRPAIQEATLQLESKHTGIGKEKLGKVGYFTQYDICVSGGAHTSEALLHRLRHGYTQVDCAAHALPVSHRSKANGNVAMSSSVNIQAMLFHVTCATTSCRFGFGFESGG